MAIVKANYQGIVEAVQTVKEACCTPFAAMIELTIVVAILSAKLVTYLVEKKTAALQNGEGRQDQRTGQPAPEHVPENPGRQRERIPRQWHSGWYIYVEQNELWFLADSKETLHVTDVCGSLYNSKNTVKICTKCLRKKGRRGYTEDQQICLAV